MASNYRRLANVSDKKIIKEMKINNISMMFSFEIIQAKRII